MGEREQVRGGRQAGRPATLRGGDGVVDDEEQEEAASSTLGLFYTASSTLGLLYTARPGYMQTVQAPL